MKKICGIYKITNTATKDCYIGSSINIEKRKREHFNSLRRGKNNSIFLQAAFDKYLESSFVFEILEECEEYNLKEREDFYLGSIVPLYNLCKKAYTTKGVKVSEETKQKHRERNLRLGIKPPEKTWRDKMKVVQMIHPISEEVLKEFESASEAARSFGKPSYCGTNISKVCRGERELIYNFKWKYKE
jgi:hypothetical protein